VRRGEPRIRPFVSIPVSVPPACASLPDRDTEPTATPQVSRMIRVAPGPIHMSSVPIDVHGSPDRVKDVSSFVRALIRRLHDECVRNVSPHADHVPLLILPEGTCCRRCDRLHGNEPQVHAIRTDLDPRCSANPRRLTASRESGCLPPLRPREISRDRPLAHAAHTFSPWLGTRCFERALQAQRHETCRHLVAPCVATSREQVAFMTALGGVFRLVRVDTRLGLTTQARQRGSVCKAIGES
jgi:hypothetical protein